MQQKDFKIFKGNSNDELVKKIAKSLNKKISKANISKFSDGEVRVEIDENVRLKEVFIIQSICSPVNTNLMELLIMADALKRSAPASITAVIPYFGYARQDKKVRPRVPITAKLVADIITKAGVSKVITVDLHAGQIQGFFDIPVDNIFAAPILLPFLKKSFDMENTVLISPDAGGVERTRAIAKRLNAKLAIVNKRRSAPNQATAMEIIGDVKNKTTILLDDMVDTAGTLTSAANIIKKEGAKEVYACCTHGVLSGDAIKKIEKSHIKSLIVTDTVPLREEAKKSGKVKVLTISSLIGKAIKYSRLGKSVHKLFV